ncbi:imidazole glycerol phosphate synthase subunit HisH [Sphingosinicella rhizophila]|uniref:Imidazole glycerol phosphate synthase subunit HisH n=1 Tax=Sphingosinicella rhizophila TaxID=3050082 RepID=A0ABU3Q1U5_9SPHN|nr:imidazole glycerol phosphate synthase subunit HisH [Sphingosinicella sp. GR2756]MDT9597344.1 imidazole glycerol phosphate synthase subunit HisH [Sphingosinicella sp. GR2756]
MRLALVDYGAGNIGSVAIAFERLGLEPLLTADVSEIAAADRVIIPGVGAAGEAMAEMRKRELVQPLRALKQPVLGICLGMQLLFERSEENRTECLGIIPGAVRRLTPAPDRPVPHMGWSSLSVRDPAIGLVQGDYVYFAHGFACDDGPYSVATADYGRPIPAVVRRDNYIGAQFHPEKSGVAGARFLEAFLVGGSNPL